MVEEPARRNYPRGLARREEILDTAAECFRQFGYDGASMREIAAACGLSQAGLLHHFPTKNALLLELVSRRDTNNAQAYNEEPPAHWPDEAWRLANENLENIPEMQFWQRMSVEATDSTNPAHDYFAKRYTSTISDFADWMAATRPDESPEEHRLKAELLVALWDGLNFQQLLLPEHDMRPAFAYALEMLQRFRRAE